MFVFVFPVFSVTGVLLLQASATSCLTGGSVKTCSLVDPLTARSKNGQALQKTHY